MGRTYEEYKTILAKRCRNTEHFTEEFLQTFLDAWDNAALAAIHGEDNTYCVDNVLLNHAYDKVYESEFYNKNSCCYCEFLSVHWETMRRYELSFVAWDESSHSYMVRKETLDAESIDKARRWAEEYRRVYHAENMEVKEAA